MKRELSEAADLGGSCSIVNTNTAKAEASRNTNTVNPKASLPNILTWLTLVSLPPELTKQHHDRALPTTYAGSAEAAGVVLSAADRSCKPLSLSRRKLSRTNLIVPPEVRSALQPLWSWSPPMQSILMSQ